MCRKLLPHGNFCAAYNTLRRWSESHSPTPLLLQNFEYGSGPEIFSNLKILLKLRKPSMQPKFSNVCNWAMTFMKTMHAPATAENEKWLRKGMLSNNKTGSAFILILEHVVVLNVAFRYFNFCSVHVQQLSHWRSWTVVGPRNLYFFINWATCFKRLRTPDLNAIQKITQMDVSVSESSIENVSEKI